MRTGAIGRTGSRSSSSVRTLIARQLRPGGARQVPCAGLTWVGVHPDHRRQGVLTAMLRHHLEQVRAEARGVPVAMS